MVEQIKERINSLNIADKLNRPSVRNQLTFLYEIEAFRLNGDVNRIDERIVQLPQFRGFCKRHPDLISRGLPISRKLQLLSFDDAVVMAINSAEKTGNLEHGIRSGIEHCELLISIKDKSSRKLYVGCFVMVLALAVLLFVPALLADALESVLANSYLQIKKTPATPIILFIGANQSMIVLLISVLTLAGVSLYWIRQDVLAFNTAQLLLRPLTAYFAAARSLRFMLAWKLYKRAGIPLDRAGTALRKILGERVWEKINARIETGESLSQAIVQEHIDFSPYFVSINTLSKLSGNAFDKAAASMVKLLVGEQKLLADRAANLLAGIAASAAIAVILLIAYGLILPLMSLQAQL